MFLKICESFLLLAREIRASVVLNFGEPKFREALGFAFLNHPAATKEMERGTFELGEKKWLSGHFSNYSLFLNVGANTGYFALMAAKFGLKVIAIEPDETNFKFLIRNFSANGFENFELYSMALSDSNGALSLFGSSSGASLVEVWAGQRGH